MTPNQVNRKITSVTYPKQKDVLNFVNSDSFCLEALDHYGEQVNITKHKGKWWIFHNDWEVSHKQLSMAICLAWLKFKGVK